MELFLPEPQPENSLNTITEFMTGLCWFVSQCSDHGPLLSDVQCPRATISYVLSVWSCYGQKSKSVSCHSVLKRNRSPIYVVNFRAFFFNDLALFFIIKKMKSMPCLVFLKPHFLSAFASCRQDVQAERLLSISISLFWGDPQWAGGPASLRLVLCMTSSLPTVDLAWVRSTCS